MRDGRATRARRDGVGPRVRPVHRAALLDELTARIDGASAGRVRALLDGPPPSGTGEIADDLARRLRVLGRPVLRVRALHFVRPASVRLEHGRHDPDELLEGWLDEAGLRREVLDPAGPTGSGQVLPRLWDLARDRAFRDPKIGLPENGVLLLDGALLLGRGLPAELTVHLRLTDAALARRLDPAEHWSLPAYRRYAAEHAPTSADVVVLADDPTRTALVEHP